MSRITIFPVLLFLTFLSSSALGRETRVGVPSWTAGVINQNTRPLKILTWNISMRPFLTWADHNQERARGIAEVLRKSEYDIIVFEEAFDSAARRIIQRILRSRYDYYYGPANREPGAFICDNSGVWVVSRIPLQKVRELEFRQARGADRFAHKGAMLLEGSWMGRRFQLIAAHIQSDKYSFRVRLSQMEEIRTDVVLPFCGGGLPQIILGDLNTDRSDSAKYSTMLKTLDAEDGTFTGTEKATYAVPGNEFIRERKASPRQIDYILVRNPEEFLSIARRSVELTRPWGRGRQHLSDHNAVEALIRFSAVPATLTALNGSRSQGEIPWGFW